MIKKILIFTMLGAVLIGCASVESEQKKWGLLKAEVNNYIAKYPQISKELTTQFKTAEKVYNQSLDISEEDAKIKKMNEASSILNKPPLRTIKEYESKLKKTERLIADIKDDFTQEEFGNKTLYLIKEATPIVNKAKEVFNDTNDSNILQAVSTQNLILTSTLSNLKKHYDEIMIIRHDKEQEALAIEAEKEEVSEALQTTENTESTKSDKKANVVLIKCKKCGTKSESGTPKCKSCGALLK